ncbi:hypothetical protein GV791_20095 [Nocardia cyriacigeorgica]|uniref:Uncharacterized protein n=2 Tax=Nocardia cyriacigeorgica TaxID=135487 RepID=H6R8L4_NOCCG|nr:hypothetical protein [Nocardia cyriacigeorgica]MBF6084884.1 hypothetical protein [Nocardia cyriacigeorgica]MBF6424879.1 hypothetical protein [Nocardia cyriacigeorgica]NEW34843.1 hypothetical protein [Nocardia cyriacigeorgica]CCF61042.1 exported protein of unknown function [Nocardia cyriacigeorgica GUH-2]BDT84465.1 hypothetical protein FMUAM8_02290 [Nocardia cyriacigeorgica]
MRNHLRIATVAGALLLAPLAAAVPASAIPLEPAPAEQTAPIYNPGCHPGGPHIDCLLLSLSAGGSSN